jgi:hypothetical protein
MSYSSVKYLIRNTGDLVEHDNFVTTLHGIQTVVCAVAGCTDTYSVVLICLDTNRLRV